MFCLMSAVELVGVKICWVHVKAGEMRMLKLVFGLSLAHILPEEMKKIFSPKTLDLLMCCDLHFSKCLGCLNIFWAQLAQLYSLECLPKSSLTFPKSPLTLPSIALIN